MWHLNILWIYFAVPAAAVFWYKQEVLLPETGGQQDAAENFRKWLSTSLQCFFFFFWKTTMWIIIKRLIFTSTHFKTGCEFSLLLRNALKMQAAGAERSDDLSFQPATSSRTLVHAKKTKKQKDAILLSPLFSKIVLTVNFFLGKKKKIRTTLFDVTKGVSLPLVRPSIFATFLQRTIFAWG